MNLALSQKHTLGSKTSGRRFDRFLLKSRRHKALRLRFKRPQWVRVALLVLAGDIVLAAAVWIVVDFLLC
jgi:hypothetical protein